MPLHRKIAAPGVMLLTLDEQRARNAIGVDLALGLDAAIAELGSDPEVRVIVLTGADPAFSSGMDLRDISAGRTIPLDFIDRIARLEKPVIAAVNGVAATGGLELALACHLRFASDRARFFDLHARLGLFPKGGLSARLTQLVSISTAIDMALSGREVAADEALALGLIDRVLPHEGFLEQVVAEATKIAEVNDDLARRMLALYRTSAELPLAEALAAELEGNRAWHASGDHKSGSYERFRATRGSGIS